MLKTCLAATTALAMMAGVAIAQTSATVGAVAPQSPGVGEPIMTISPPASLNGRPSESAVVTGSEGSTAPATVKGADNLHLPIDTEYRDLMATTAVTGHGSSGMLTDDGDATSTIVPGQPPKLVSTPE
jgi:hypothetical protein